VVTGAGNSFTAAGTLSPILRGITGHANNDYSPVLGTSFTVVDAEGGVSGSFKGMTQPASGLSAGTRLDALYWPNQLVLYATPATYTNLADFGIALTQNQRSTGAALDALRPSPGVRTDADATHVLGRIFVQPAGTLPYTLNHLSPTGYGDAMLTGLTVSRGVGDSIGRQQQVRRGMSAKGSDTTVRVGDLNFWLAGSNGYMSGNATGNTGFRANSWGTTVGVDVLARNDVHAGFALGYNSARTTTSQVGSTVVNNMLHGVGYGGVQAGRAFIDGQLGFAVSQVESNRMLGVVGLTAKGSGHGLGLNAGVTIGAQYALGGVRLQPELGLRIDQLSRGQITETGGRAASLIVNSASVYSVRSTLGGRVEKAFESGGGTTFTPSVRLHWAHDYTGTTVNTTAAFIGAPRAAMVMASPRMGEDAVVVGLDATLATAHGISAFVSVQGEIRSHGSAQAIGGGVRIQW
jgi:uncharacterized protein with beta-barrel porin domain